MQRCNAICAITYHSSFPLRMSDLTASDSSFIHNDRHTSTHRLMHNDHNTGLFSQTDGVATVHAACRCPISWRETVGYHDPLWMSSPLFFFMSRLSAHATNADVENNAFVDFSCLPLLMFCSSCFVSDGLRAPLFLRGPVFVRGCAVGSGRPRGMCVKRADLPIVRLQSIATVVRAVSEHDHSAFVCSFTPPPEKKMTPIFSFNVSALESPPAFFQFVFFQIFCVALLGRLHETIPTTRSILPLTG